MNTKKYYTAKEKSEKDIMPDDYNCTSFARTVVIDGARYPVISVVPKPSQDLVLDCAEDKFLQLITGTKN